LELVLQIQERRMIMDTPHTILGLPPVMVTPTDDLPPNVKAELRFMNTEELLLRYRDRNGLPFQKFISPQDAKSAFTGIELDTDWIPGGVRRFGVSSGGWWFISVIPAHREDITLLDGKKGEVINVPLPTLVMVGHSGGYDLWAMRGGTIDPEGKLYRVPLPNVSPQGGGICWGTSTAPEVHADNAQRAWELFIQTPFNDHHIDAKSRMFPGDVRQQLRKLSQAKKKAYPVRDLVYDNSSCPTLKAIISRIKR
jgi:hypothetical protein